MRRTGMKTLIILCDNNFYASNAFTTQFLFARRKYQTVLIKIKLYLAECGIEEMRNAELTSTSSPTRFQEESRRFEYHIDLALRSHFLSSICYSHVKSAINSAPRHGAFVWVWGLKRQALAIKIERNEDVFIGRNSIERQSFNLLPTRNAQRKFHHRHFPISLNRAVDTDKITANYQALRCLIGANIFTLSFSPAAVSFRFSQMFQEIGVESLTKRMQSDAHAWNWVIEIPKPAACNDKDSRLNSLNYSRNFSSSRLGFLIALRGGN